MEEEGEGKERKKRIKYRREEERRKIETKEKEEKWGKEENKGEKMDD